MSNLYGPQTVPKIQNCTDFRTKYWGWIKTCIATHDFTIKHIFMKKNNWSEEEAVEWVDYNVMGVQPNGAGFIMMFDREMIDMDEIESKIGSDE